MEWNGMEWGWGWGGGMQRSLRERTGPEPVEGGILFLGFRLSVSPVRRVAIQQASSQLTCAKKPSENHPC